MTPNQIFHNSIILSLLFLYFPVNAHFDYGLSSSKRKDSIQWKKGFIQLANGKKYAGETRYFFFGNTIPDRIEFRLNEKDESQVFMAESCISAKWGHLEFTTFHKKLKNGKKKVFYLNIYNEIDLRIFTLPKLFFKSRGFSLFSTSNFLVSKNGILNSISSTKFRKLVLPFLKKTDMPQNDSALQKNMTYKSLFKALRTDGKYESIVGKSS